MDCTTSAGGRERGGRDRGGRERDRDGVRLPTPSWDGERVREKRQTSFEEGSSPESVKR
jgi:hypothetical protein